MIEGLNMEEKESTDSGSPVINSVSDISSSPPASGGYSSGDVAAVVVPPAAAPAGNVSIGVAGAAPPAGGGAVVGSEMVNSGALVVAVGSSGRSGGKKRGRPRKYDENGNLNPSYIKSATPVVPPPPGFFSTTPPATIASGKRGRGRPAVSGNSQIVAPCLSELYISTAGADFTPHVVQVSVGEDLGDKIFSLALSGNRGVCVMSANGVISNVTIRQPCSAGGTLTYEGRFEILSLTGSYALLEKNGINARTGSLSVSLAGPDGRVIGGAIAGMLRAAGPIQMVVGSFNLSKDEPQKKKRKPYGPRSASPRVHSAPALPVLPISQAPPNGNSFPAPTPQAHEMRPHGEVAINSSYNGTPIPAPNFTAAWNGGEAAMQQRPSPDINVSAPVEE